MLPSNCHSHVQISDLGLARKAGLFVPHEGGKFPIKWTAPEALKYSVRVDTSLQLVLPVFVVLNWEMFCVGVVSIYRPSGERSIRTADGMQMEENGCLTMPIF